MSDGRVARALAPYVPFVPPCRAGDGVAGAAGRVLACVSERPGVVLVIGPSGAGKSTLVRAVAESLRSAGEGVVRADRSRVAGDRPVAGLARRVGLDDWLGCLSLAGLADARLLATRARDLSEGESARLRLALAFARLSGVRGGWLVCDEFCSVLDRDTAGGVAASLRRWARGSSARVLVATAHADVERLLGPDWVARVGADGSVSVERGSGRAGGPRLRVERGTMADYRPFAGLHYRSGEPSAVCRVLRAVRGGRVVGVLVASYPTLNGSWRELAWPGRYVTTPDRRAAAARRLNREVRRLTRVVVDPRDRGRGVARRLVNAYLSDPETPITEAVSAMGRLSPFARAAGMTEYPLPPRPADDRLADMLDAIGVEPWELMDTRRVGALRRSADGAFLGRELRGWAAQVRSSIPAVLRRTGDAFVCAPLAGARLCAPPRAYVHVA